MAEIRAFRAMRFTAVAGEPGALACPPYDVINEGEREAYLRENPHNIIRLELPREGDDPYATAGKTLEDWIREGILACDEQPALYLYEEEFQSFGSKKRIRGLCCRVRLEEWEKGVVLPHEETLSKAKEDRFNLMCATGANFSSVYSLYFDGDGTVAERLEQIARGTPLMEFETPRFDHIRHRVWAVEDEAAVSALSGAFGDKKLYIADGHHRYETAIRYRDHLRAQGKLTGPDHPANFIMMTLVAMEDPGLVVLPTHRVVRDLQGFDAEELSRRCGEYFEMETITEPDFGERLHAVNKTEDHAFVLARPGKMELMTLRDVSAMDALLPGTSAAYRALDVNILHTLVLERLLGIDKENMAGGRNLTYTRDFRDALEAVVKGEANCAFLLGATGVEEIAAIASAGEKMPQKSTYFYPKLVTGHLMNLLSV